MFTSLFIVEPGHTKEQQWETLGETSISSVLGSRWLLYTQPIMSEGNTTHTEIRATLDAVKKGLRLSKWAAVKDTVLKAHFTKKNTAENYLRSHPPS